MHFRLPGLEGCCVCTVSAAGGPGREGGGPGLDGGGAPLDGGGGGGLSPGCPLALPRPVVCAGGGPGGLWPLPGGGGPVGGGAIFGSGISDAGVWKSCVGGDEAETVPEMQTALNLFTGGRKRKRCEYLVNFLSGFHSEITGAYL